MRVVIAHHITTDLSRFAKAPSRGQTQFAHGVKDPPVNRFEPIARIGQRAVHDCAQRIGQITIANRATQRLGGNSKGWSGGINGCVHNSRDRPSLRRRKATDLKNQ